MGAAVAAAVLALVPTAPAAWATTTPAAPVTYVDLGGTPTEGGSDRDPVTLTAGLWSTTLVGSGSNSVNTQWFRYERTMADSTVLVGAVATSPDEAADQVQVTLTAGDAEECDDATGYSEFAAPQSAFGVQVSAGVDSDGDNRGDACASAAEVVIAVKRGTVDRETEMPVAIRIVEQAPVTGDTGDYPMGEQELPLPTRGEPTPLAGATSFADAPEIGSGSYSDAVTEGTEHLWRVRLDWGQSLAVRLDVPAIDAAVDEALPGVGPQVRLTPITPLRGTYPGDLGGTRDSDTYGSDPLLLFEGAARVLYQNRFAPDLASVAPGDYWISVAVQPVPVSEADEREPIDVPVELTVVVGGAAVEPPEFAPAVLGPGISEAPPGYDPGTPYLVDDGVFSADVSGTPRVRETAEEPAGDGSTAAAGDDSTRTTAGWALGALSLLSVAAGVVLLSRRSATR